MKDTGSEYIRGVFDASLPQVPEPFSWIQSSCGVVLTCRPLDAIAPHAFTTRHLQLSSPDDWARVASLVGARETATLTQVHGRTVLPVDHTWTPPRAARPEADALASRNPNVALAVRAADCVPLLIADSRTGAVAAVHAGWRGTAAGIARAAVAALSRRFDAKPEDLVAAIGPSIGACCYEVGSELVDAFAAAGHTRDLVDRWFMIRQRRMFLDVPGANRDQLVLAGVREENIHLSNLCTAMHLDVLTSYRAEKEHAGRIAGIIRSRGAGK